MGAVINHMLLGSADTELPIGELHRVTELPIRLYRRDTTTGR